MTKTEKPKTLKFPKPDPKKCLFISDGLVSNVHWLFDTAWILSLKPEASLGYRALKNKITGDRTQVTIAKLKGESVPTADLRGVFNSFRISEYRDAGAPVFISGYVNGNPLKTGVVEMTFTTPNSPRLAIGYATACFFDSTTKVMVRDNAAPVLLVKNGQVVGIVMCLKPNN